MSKGLVIVVLALVVSGCKGVGLSESPLWHGTASQETKIEYFKAECLGFGYKSRTPEMAQCIQTQMNQSKTSAGKRMDSINQSHRTITCKTWGNTTRCSE
tara:strand:- start:56 stop:355 length:300 start_codon:yes stop_codon:yes gene_type:complete